MALQKQHYNNLKAYLATSPPRGANARRGRVVLQHAGLVGKAASPHKPLGLRTRPLPHRQTTFCLSPKCWGQVEILPQLLRLEPPTTSNLQNFVVQFPILQSDSSIDICSLSRHRQTQHLPHLGKFIGNFSYPRLKFIGCHSGSLLSHHNALLSVGHSPQATPHSNYYISQLTPPSGEVLSILKSRCHKLSNAYGLTLVTPSLCGWEVFLTHKALIHTRITSALSPMTPQVSGVTPGVPLVPMMSRAILMERCMIVDYHLKCIYNHYSNKFPMLSIGSHKVIHILKLSPKSQNL